MLVALLFLAVSAPPLENQTSQPEPRRYHEINDDLTALIRREARAENKGERAQVIREMADLYRELKHDPRLEISETIKGYKFKLWRKLVDIRQDLKQEIARENRQRKTSEEEEALLASAYQTSENLAANMTLVSYSLGGPAQMLAESGAQFGGGAIQDDGEVLVDLIQRVINPDIWDVNGGPASIVYFAPLKVLVVTATGEVHERIGGAVKGLRRAGP